MWCNKYGCITTMVIECENKGCILCKYSEEQDGERVNRNDKKRTKSKSNMQ